MDSNALALVILIYIVVALFSLWISYTIMKNAVKNGMLDALDIEHQRRAGPTKHWTES